MNDLEPARGSAWPLCAYAPGDYMGTCVDCGQQFTGAKRSLQCLECAARSAKGLIEIYQEEARQLRQWREDRRVALDELIRAASVFWGAGSEQHNLVRDVSDALFRTASADTHPKDGDVEQAPLVSGAVPEADAQTSPSVCDKILRDAGR